MQYPAERGNYLRSVVVCPYEPEVFRNAEYDVRRVGFRPGDEFRGCGDVFCDRLFGEDVFSRCEGAFDVGWLDGDGEAVVYLLELLGLWGGKGYSRNDYAFDIVASQQFIVAGAFIVVAV